MTRRQGRKKITKIKTALSQVLRLNPILEHSHEENEDEQDKASLLRQLYNPKYMKAIINNMIEMYKVDEDDGFIPYDSI